MIRKRITTLSLIVSLVVSCACANAAYFRVDSDSGAALRPGDSFSLKVYMTPGDGEKVDGAKCTINVDPEFIEISPARSDYSADPTFKLVEVFKTDPEQGMVSFRARTAESVEDEKLFLVVPAKLKKEGSTFVNLTSSTLAGDGGWAPSAPGYFKLLGVGDEDVDPLIASTLESENSLLNAGAFYHSYKVKPQSDSSISSMQFDMGMTALEQAEDEATADIVVKFSKDKARIGLGKYVRLDLIIEKYPEEAPVFTGIDVKIKFDPTVLQFTNSLGQAVSQVEIVKPLDDLDIRELKALAKGYELEYSSVDFRGETKSDELQRSELMDMIRSYEGYRDETIFSNPFGAEEVDLSGNHAGLSPEESRNVTSALDANFVDNIKGEIHLMLLVNFMLERNDIVFPQKVVTLIFKTNKPIENAPVEITQALLGEAYGTLLVKNAYITVDPHQDACDKTLPASLCKGTFDVNGDISFQMTKKRTQRDSLGPDGMVAGKTVVEKLALTETWNVHMDGSLENGLKVKGHINKIPDTEQKLDIGVSGDNGSIRFGDFNTGFNGTSKVNTPSSQISGMELQYGFGDFTFSALTAEGRSESKTDKLIPSGNGKTYSLPNAAIIPNTVQISYKEDDDSTKVVPTTEYSIDYAKGTVNFNDLSTTSGVKDFFATYEYTTFLFSGNINSFGLAYDSQKDNPQKKERFKVDTAYTVSRAAKGGNSFIKEGSRTLNLGSVKVEDCPEKRATGSGDYEAHASCQTVYLPNRNIVSGSIKIKVQNNTFNENSEGVYVTHRSYAMGKVTLDREKGFKADITITYSYYDPGAIYDKRIKTLNSELPLDGSTGLMEFSMYWTSDILQGSEEIYLSKNTDSSISSDDLYVGYKYPGIDPWLDEEDDSAFSTESILDTGADYAYNTTYYYDTQFLTALPSRLYFDSQMGTLGQDYKYLKMRYKTVPQETEGSSEFAKKAIGVDVMYQPLSNLRFDAQYAITNSDLSSSYVTDEETFNIDEEVITHESDISTERYGEICSYIVKGSDRKVVCGLSHGNIKDPVEVTLRFCKPKNNDPKEPCELKADGTYEYEDEVYQFSSIIHRKLITIDSVNATISFNRDVKVNTDGTIEDNTFHDGIYAFVNHRFITAGDRISVRYLYAQTVDELVEGDTLTLKTNYIGKKLDFTITKSITDPYYDNSFKGSLKDGSDGNVDTTNVKMNYKFNKQWSAFYEKSSATNKKLEAGVTSSSTDSVTRNHTVTYSNSKAKHLNSFYLSNRQIEKTGVNGLGIKDQNVYNTNDSKEARANVTVLKDIMNFNTSYKTTNVIDYRKKESALSPYHTVSTRTENKMLETNINPISMLSTTLKFQRDDSSSGDSTRSNTYKAVLKPIKYFTIDMNFDRTNKKAASNATLTENNTYTVKFIDFSRISNFSIDLTQNRTPASNTIPYSTGSDRQNTKFDLKIANGFVFTPSLEQSETRTENLVDRDKTSYKLEYQPPKNRFKLKLTFSRGNTDSTTFAKYLSENQTVTKDNIEDQTATFYFKPSTKSTVDVYYKDSSAEKTPASTFKQYDIKYNLSPTKNTSFSSHYKRTDSTAPKAEYYFDYKYNYTNKLSFSTSYKRSWTGSTTGVGSVLTSYDFNSSVKLSDSSALDMSYKQTIARGQKLNAFGNEPNFSARLRTSFR